MSTKKIEVICSKLKKEYDDFSSGIDNFIVSESVAKSLFADIEAKTRSQLSKIFGDEGDTKKVGLIEEVLRYNNAQKPTFNPFCDAIIFAYWSHRGDISKYLVENRGYWRDNLFYKGNRWSNNSLKDAFYLFFKLIEHATDGNTPVKFFTKIGIQNNKPMFCVSYGKDSITEMLSISLPTANDLMLLNIGKLNLFLQSVSEYRNIAIDSYPNINVDSCKAFLKNQKLTEESIKKLFNEIYEELFKKRKDVLIKWRKSVVSILGEIKDVDEDEQLKQICYLVLSYQYYDNPYRIFFFLPSLSASDHPLPQSALIVTTAVNNKAIFKVSKSFKIISNTLNNITQIEQKIFFKFTEHLPIYWQWKDHYHKWHEKYEILSEMAVNICRAIALNREVKIQHSPHRVKDFDSFYAKIIKKINDPTSKRMVNKKKIKDALLRGTDVDTVFGALKDIAGARAICLYSKEVQTIREELDKLVSSGQIIKITPPRDHQKSIDSESKGYRAIHYWFTIGEKRKEIYEFKDLQDLKCEIQIRTVLSDGWALASHEINYKPGIESELRNDHAYVKILDDLFNLSAEIENKDDKLQELRERFDGVCDKYYRESKRHL